MERKCALFHAREAVSATDVRKDRMKSNTAEATPFRLLPVKQAKGRMQRMKRLLFASVAIMTATTGCVSLSYTEKQELRYLEANGIDVDHGRGGFDAPNSVTAAGLLNVLPGFGNFYLMFGRGNDGVQGVYGVLNLLLWPISIVWGAPQAAIDAHTLNQRELLYFYHYEKSGRTEMQRSGLKFD